ncbi:MAG: AAA family ATPase [Thermoplasmata archaeon]
MIPWVEKYRPTKIDHIISHREIVRTLKKFIQLKTLPHLLFFGPSGSGKTSTIICCGNEIYGSYYDCMILRLNASNERGIETVRTKIKNFVSNRNSIFLPPELRSIFKLVILDEIDSMTVEAQGMLRQTIEKNSITTRFCLICNDIDKINTALQSRCAIFRFSPLDGENMKLKLLEICRSENIKYQNDAIEAIVNISHGDLRLAINILQHLNLTVGKTITIENVYRVSGYCLPKLNHKLFQVLSSLYAGEISLEKCVEKIVKKITDHNITIYNLLENFKDDVLNSNFTTNQKIYLLDNMAHIEVYDAVNMDPTNIIMNLASLFVLVKNI